MFKLAQFLVRFLLFLVFLIASPLILLISMAFADSFAEAFSDTIEIMVAPLQNDTYK